MLVLTSLIFYLYRRSYVQFSPLLNDLPTFNTTNFHSPSILRYETILYISDICIINEIMDPESGRFLTFVSSVGLKDQNRGQGNGSSPSLLPIPFPGRVWAFICTQTLVNRGRKVLAIRYKLGGSPPSRWPIVAVNTVWIHFQASWIDLSAWKWFLEGKP